MTSWLVIFRAFFVPPTINLKKNPVNQPIKNSGLSTMANSDTTCTRIGWDQDHISASLWDFGTVANNPLLYRLFLDHDIIILFLDTIEKKSR